MTWRRLGTLTFQTIGVVLLVVFALVFVHLVHQGMEFILGGELQSTLIGWVVSGIVFLCWYGGAFRHDDVVTNVDDDDEEYW